MTIVEPESPGAAFAGTVVTDTVLVGAAFAGATGLSFITVTVGADPSVLCPAIFDAGD